MIISFWGFSNALDAIYFFFPQILAKNDNPDSADRVVNYLNHKGWTALSSACQKGKSDIVELLLDAGANPNVTAQELFPIHYALKNDDNK